MGRNCTLVPHMEPYLCDDALRRRMADNLRTFERVALDGDGLRHAAVAVCVIDNKGGLGRGADEAGPGSGETWSGAGRGEAGPPIKDNGEACYLITRRAGGLRSHAGQWALPGGSLDPGESAEEAARRELHEELGLHVDADGVLGLLDDYVTRSGYLVTPVVVWAAGSGPLVPNPDEVESAYSVPLRELDAPGVPRLLTIPESDRPVIQLPIGERNIHAPTAVFLYQLREVALHGRSTRVAHFEQPVFAWR